MTKLKLIVKHLAHPMPCDHCGHAARLVVGGKRCCWLCFDRERKS